MFDFLEWGRRGPSRGDKREEAGCGVEWPVGRVSKWCSFLPLVLGKKIAFPKSYS